MLYIYVRACDDLKTQNEREVNIALRVENEKLLTENVRIKEALKNVFCQSCGGPPNRDHEEHMRSLEKLELENARLKEEAS